MIKSEQGAIWSHLRNGKTVAFRVLGKFATLCRLGLGYRNRGERVIGTCGDDEKRWALPIWVLHLRRLPLVQDDRWRRGDFAPRDVRWDWDWVAQGSRLGDAWETQA